MSLTSAWVRPLPRLLCIAALLLFLTFVFSSQLYFAGFVTPWSRAFAQEAIYWLSCGVLAIPILWMCRRLHRGAYGWVSYALALMLGAIIAVALQPAVAFSIGRGLATLHLCQTACGEGLKFVPHDFVALAIRSAGINLAVYAGFVLAWHAAIYYREGQDRQLKSVELESLLHQAQLQALRNQLNPHFLFNALHSIAELVHDNPKLAEKLIVRLGELLRQVLQSATLPEVPLADELDFIRGYIDIEQMRLGDRLQVEWAVSPQLLMARVPSLILQPLVENAIQHGIAPTSKAGVLTISARREEQSLILEIRDTGPGMPQAAERRLGIGLTNTSARLARLYGDRQKLELIGDDGLLVILRIPFSEP
ncbi:MAG TPA: histidine kinase [Steroidobacteraceae bacterium]|nr:histidine kinase [Steroidobacteraceae bacterium]